MALKRKLYKRLLDWKTKRNGSTALLLNGARRVGKSFICEQFGHNEYKSMIIIDFANISSEVRDIFEHESTHLDLFFNKVSAYYDTRLYPRDSLIIFDEVQQFPKARQLIKYLVADGRYDYIETGSLLTLKHNIKDIVIPSEEEHIEVFPLDFEEFLWALGNDTMFSLIEMCFHEKKPLGQALHRKIMNDFRQYMLVGGMPQAVLAYTANMDFEAAEVAKRNILNLYRDDITKFAYGYENKVRSIFDSLPSQLAKREKKFTLAAISKEARFRTYEDAFMWLKDAMIINPCFNSTDPNIGLAMSSDHTTQKIYLADTGLLVTQALSSRELTRNEIYKSVLFDKLHINEGMFTENIVAQTLVSSGHSLYFYSRVDKGNRDNMMEIDFLLIENGKISPLEVKSSDYRKHSSLDKFRRKFSHRLGESYIIYSKDLMIKDGVTHLPLYMAMFL